MRVETGRVIQAHRQESIEQMRKMYPDLEKDKKARAAVKPAQTAAAFATRTLIRREGKLTKVPDQQTTTVTHRLLSKYSHELGHLKDQNNPGLVANSRLMRYELEHDSETNWKPVLGSSTRITKV